MTVNGDAEHALITTGEIGARLGITRVRVGQIAATDPTFPRPARRVGLTRLYRSIDVDHWAAEHRRPTMQAARRES